MNALRTVLCASLFVGASVAGATTAHRNPPAVPNAGGASKALRLVALIPNGYPEAATVAQFIRSIPGSQWLASLQTAYPPPAGAPPDVAAKVLFVDGMPDLLLHDQTAGIFQDFIYKKARAAGLVQDRSRQTIFVFFSPCAAPHGLNSFGCSSHHPGLDWLRFSPTGHSESDLFTSGDSMAAILSPLSTAIDKRTLATSHELAEAYTDTKGVGQWRLHSAHADNPWLDTPPWVRATGTIEVADLAAGSAWFEVDPVSHKTFEYERIYSTYRATHAFNDVSVPSQAYPLYNVSTALGNFPEDWHLYTSPATISIKVTAWAEGSFGSFKVTASIFTFGGSATNPCTLIQTSWTVHDGSTFQLRLAPVLASSAPVWCTIKLKSARTSPASHDDTSRVWMVGVLVDAP